VEANLIGRVSPHVRQSVLDILLHSGVTLVGRPFQCRSAQMVIAITYGWLRGFGLFPWQRLAPVRRGTSILRASNGTLIVIPLRDNSISCCFLPCFPLSRRRRREQLYLLQYRSHRAPPRNRLGMFIVPEALLKRSLIGDGTGNDTRIKASYFECMEYPTERTGAAIYRCQPFRHPTMVSINRGQSQQKLILAN
jgi:hypothetical protein